MADDHFSQTQNVNDDMSICLNDSYDSPAEDDSVWGKLFPNTKSFELVLLNKDKVTFGRNSELVDFPLKANNKHVNVGSYSSVHFTLTREKSSKDEFYVKIQDNSSNGTFVNGAKIGKGRFQILKSNDEIALAKAENKAYTFVDKSSNEDHKWPIVLREKYMICKELGKGAYGEVRLAFSNLNMKKFAIKIICKKKFTIRGRNEQNFTNQIMSEVNILKKLNHPCIIKIYEVIDTPERVFIVLELVEGGELFDKVVSIGQYDEKTAKLLFYQMVLAIKYLHDQGISHRDLKPENILLCDRENVETLIKVTDFGLSKFFDSSTVLKTFCGTPNYLAPEVLTTKGEGAYTNKVDNWSLGVILFICLAGYPPFSEENTKVTLEQQIRRGMYDFPAEYWSAVSKDAIDLIKNLLTVDPDKRYTLEQVLEHKWIKNDSQVKELAHKLMYPNDTTTPPSSNELSIDATNEDTNHSIPSSANKLKRNSDDSDEVVEDTSSNKKRLKPSKSNSTDKSTDVTV